MPFAPHSMPRQQRLKAGVLKSCWTTLLSTRPCVVARSVAYPVVGSASCCWRTRLWSHLISFCWTSLRTTSTSAVSECWTFLASLSRDCAVVVASHDRAFLDAVTSCTVFLRPAESVDFSLPYCHAVQALLERDMALDRQFENDMRKVRTLRQQAANLKNIGINSGSDLLVIKTKQLSERAEKLEKHARPAHHERSAGAIRLSNSGSYVKALLSIGETEITAPDGRILFRTGKLWIENGNRVVLLGANGSGKTMLAERMRRALTVSDPNIRGAASLKLAHSDQALSQLDAFPTPWQAVKELSMSPTRTRALCLRAPGSPWRRRLHRLRAFQVVSGHVSRCYCCGSLDRISTCWTSRPTISTLKGKKCWRPNCWNMAQTACSALKTAPSSAPLGREFGLSNEGGLSRWMIPTRLLTG